MRIARTMLAAVGFSLLGVSVSSADCLIAGCDPISLNQLTAEERVQLNAASSRELRKIKKRRKGSDEVAELTPDPPKVDRPIRSSTNPGSRKVFVFTFGRISKTLRCSQVRRLHQARTQWAPNFHCRTINSVETRPGQQME